MRNTTRSVMVLGVMVGLASAGCSDMYLADDIDLELDFNALEGASDTLHTPYVQGTQVVIYAHDALDDDEPSWRLESSDQSVLRVAEHGDGFIRCTAVGAGTAAVRVYDEDGDRVHSGTIEVRAPTRAELYAHGPLIIGRSDEEAHVAGTIRVVQGGTATFLVRYFDGDQELFGNGVLSAVAAGDDQLELFEETSFLFENREWLQMRPITASTMELDLYGDGLPVGHFTVQGVMPIDVDHIELIGESERGAADEESLAVLAQGYDRDGNAIYGIEFLWNVDGVLQPGMGDLYRYEYDADADVDVEASFQDMTAGATIHSGGGYVSSTNIIGCSATAAAPGPVSTPILLVFAMLTVALARRRREP